MLSKCSFFQISVKVNVLCMTGWIFNFLSQSDHLIGLVVKVSALIVTDPGFDSCLGCGDFSVSSHTSDLKIGTQVATLPSVIGSAGTGWPGVSIL